MARRSAAFVRRVRARLRRQPPRVQMARPYVISNEHGPELDGLVAVVTGGSGAIGRATALRLAVSGAAVHVVGRNASRLADVVREIRELGGIAHQTEVDLTNDAETARLFASFPAVDVLVNCAGGSTREAHAPVWEQTSQIVDDVLDANLRSAISCIRATTPGMVERRSGRIVSIGSILADHGKPRFAEYAAAKAGLVGYTRSAAIELGPFGVTVNVVSPGIVPRGVQSEADLARLRGTNVLNAICHEEDVAEAVGFLAGPRGRFITGHDLVVDGGRSLGLRGD